MISKEQILPIFHDLLLDQTMSIHYLEGTLTDLLRQHMGNFYTELQFIDPIYTKVYDNIPPNAYSSQSEAELMGTFSILHPIGFGDFNNINIYFNLIFYPQSYEVTIRAFY